MKNQNTTRFTSHPLTSICMVCLCILFTFGVLWLTGCAESGAETPTGEAADSENLVATEEVEGVITSIGTGELVMETISDTKGYLDGPVRVDTSQVDNALLDGLAIGDTILVGYPGVVGLSEPPYISAITIEVR